MKKNNWVGILLSFAAPCRGKLGVSILFAIISVLGGFVPYLGVYQILTLFITDTATVDGILMWSAVVMGGYIVKIVFYAFSTVLSHVSAYTILEQLRNKVADRLMQAPLGTVQGQSIGRMKNTIVDRIEEVEPPLAHVIPELTPNVLLPVIVAVTLFIVDWRMGLASLASIPFAVVPMAFGMRAFNEKYAGYMEANANVNSVIVEYVEGIEVVKTFNHSGKSYEKFIKAVSDFKDFTLDWFRSTWKPMNLSLSILPTTLLGTLPIGGFLYLSGDLSPVELVFCLLLSLGIVGPMMKAAQFVNEAKSMEFAVKDANEILQMKDLPIVENPIMPKATDISLKDVSFSYTDNPADNVLQNINLTLPTGSFTALVGPSGGGKSTVARLIARFWDVSSGSIEIGGVDIRQMSLSGLASMVSFVTQDNFLFDCSLKENIRLGNPKATDEEVFAAARAAQCEDFITRLDKGWDTSAGDAGKQLSGGERQRIAIARAILKNAPIVILDEATAFTDPENEDKIQQSIMALSKDKTLLVIAHRLSTVQNADQIVVLQKGHIVDKGKQSELMSRCDLYNELWNAHVGAKKWAVQAAKEASHV